MAISLNGNGTLTGITDYNNSDVGRILQIVQVTKTDTVSQTCSGTTEYNVLNASITPASTSSKIMVILQMNSSVGGPFDSLGCVLKRGTTPLYRGDANGSAVRLSGLAPQPYHSKRCTEININYVDTPSTTSSITYNIVFFDGNGDGGSFYINRSGTYGSDVSNFTLPSSLTLLEIG